MGKQHQKPPKFSTRAPALTSAANPVVKLLKSLDRKKARAESGLFLVEGARHLTEALDHGWQVAHVLAGASATERESNARLLARAEADGARVSIASEAVLAKVSRKDNPQTLIGAVRLRAAGLDALDASPGWGAIALFQPRDPGNLGTIIRTADCTGMKGVLVIGEACDPFSVEAVRASMGSLFAVPVVRADVGAALGWAKARGASLIGASVNGAGFGPWPDGEPLILMGAEQSGLPADVEAACASLIRLPMRAGADSLNLASASAVMIYEAWRRAGHPGAA